MAKKIEDIFTFFIELTGMSEACVKEELEHYLSKLQLDPKNIGEEDLRKILKLYLEDLNYSMLQDGNETTVETIAEA